VSTKESAEHACWSTDDPVPGTADRAGLVADRGAHAPYRAPARCVRPWARAMLARVRSVLPSS
jgi:hypothetical protein